MSGGVLAAGALLGLVAAGPAAAGPPARPGDGARAPVTVRQDGHGGVVYEGDGWSTTVVPGRRPGPGPTAEQLRRKGLVFLDATTGESIRELRPGHFEVRYRQPGGRRGTVEIEVASQTDAHLHLTLAATRAGIRYRYQIENGATAEQRLAALLMVVPTEVAIEANAPQWPRPVVDDPLLPGVSWSWIQAGRFVRLAPGHVAQGFVLATHYLPALADAVAIGVPNGERVGVREPRADHMDAAIAALYAGDEVRQTVIAPAIPPPGDSAGRGAAVRRLAGDVDRAAAAGFVDAADARRLSAALGVLGHATGDATAIAATRAVVDRLASLMPTYRAALRIVLDALRAT